MGINGIAFCSGPCAWLKIQHVKNSRWRINNRNIPSQIQIQKSKTFELHWMVRTLIYRFPITWMVYSQTPFQLQKFLSPHEFERVSIKSTLYEGGSWSTCVTTWVQNYHNEDYRFVQQNALLYNDLNIPFYNKLIKIEYQYPNIFIVKKHYFVYYKHQIKPNKKVVFVKTKNMSIAHRL